jgi:hypothetical protein
MFRGIGRAEDLGVDVVRAEAVQEVQVAVARKVLVIGPIDASRTIHSCGNAAREG